MAAPPQRSRNCLADVRHEPFDERSPKGGPLKKHFGLVCPEFQAGACMPYGSNSNFRSTTARWYELITLVRLFSSASREHLC